MGDDNVWTDEWDEGEDWSGGGARAKRLPRGDELRPAIGSGASTSSSQKTPD